MARPWVSIDRVATPDGELELRRRAADDYLMTVGGRVLMSSAARRSEEALGRVAAEAEPSAQTRVLIAGLGMGHTLRAALDCLPAGARLEVAELNPVVVKWCQTELCELNGRALHDPRVSVEIADVAEVIGRAAKGGPGEKYHAILLDLYVGPAAASDARDPFYGSQALQKTHSALRPDGLLGVWSEEPSEAFERALRRASFAVERQRVGRGGRKHLVYLARRVP